MAAIYTYEIMDATAATVDHLVKYRCGPRRGCIEHRLRLVVGFDYPIQEQPVRIAGFIIETNVAGIRRHSLAIVAQQAYAIAVKKSTCAVVFVGAAGNQLAPIGRINAGKSPFTS